MQSSRYAHARQMKQARATLRETKNILKRQLIHIGAFNISLVLRKMLGAGTQRELKNCALNLILRAFGRLDGLYRQERPSPESTGEVFALTCTFCVVRFYC